VVEIACQLRNGGRTRFLEPAEQPNDFVALRNVEMTCSEALGNDEIVIAAESGR
jgi:hypothetical protein